MSRNNAFNDTRIIAEKIKLRNIGGKKMSLVKKDPLTGKTLEVTDLSTAWHALKIARELNTAIQSKGRSNTRELERMQKERNALRINNPYSMSYVSAQLEIERQRLTAAATQRTDRLNEKLNALKEKVATWFKSEVTSGASWLNGETRLTLSGVTIQYSGGNVHFYFPVYVPETADNSEGDEG